ncbi:MAG TPA: ribonuclease E inhibitor RraB [Rhizomicrobium sp.]|nr:ribonuclease E inhibitor RraB [Rhizomicrobium sp.]
MKPSDQDKQILGVLRQHGDTLTKPREIMHWAYFPSDEARTRFAESCAKAGFAIRGMNDGARMPNRFSVQFSHTDVPNENAVDLFRSLLTKLAAESGGEYDGWQTKIVQN